MNVNITCNRCGKRFKREKNRTINNSTKKPFIMAYCSRECYKNKKILCECVKCNKKFFRTKKLPKKRKSVFCSNECRFDGKQLLNVNCKECKTNLLRYPSTIPKSGNVFCNNTCSAIYRSKNKIGLSKRSIRSKIEKYVEKKLKKEYPNLKISFNDREILNGLELDIYIPEFSVAIELNGPTHYKPIYGIKQLSARQLKDAKKAELCNEKKINLSTINISNIPNFSEKSSEKILCIIRNIINDIIII